MTDMFHPVWNVYNEQRTARLNILYLQAKLKRLHRESFWMELVIAVSASTSAAGF